MKDARLGDDGISDAQVTDTGLTPHEVAFSLMVPASERTLTIYSGDNGRRHWFWPSA